MIYNKNISKNNKNILTFNSCGAIVKIRKGAGTAGHCRVRAQKPVCAASAAGKRGCKNMQKKTITERKDIWTKGTKLLLDVMFFAGVLVTVSLPWSVKLAGTMLPQLVEHYEETVIIYFVLGVSAEKLLWELRRIFATVLQEDCFVQENVVSLRKMSNWSFFIALMSVVRSIVYMTIAMAVVVLVFAIAGLFSRVLSFVFEQAVAYKEENDFTV